MTCLLCERPNLVFGDYIAPHCIFHHSEEIKRECPRCKTLTSMRRNSLRCHLCSSESHKTSISIPLIYFIPQKNENQVQFI